MERPQNVKNERAKPGVKIRGGERRKRKHGKKRPMQQPRGGNETKATT